MREYIYANEEIYMNRAYYEEEDLEYLADEFSMKEISLLDFELIEDEIDIDGIEEIKWRESDKEYLGYGVLVVNDKINELIQALKQLNKEIKSIKEK